MRWPNVFEKDVETQYVLCSVQCFSKFWVAFSSQATLFSIREAIKVYIKLQRSLAEIDKRYYKQNLIFGFYFFIFRSFPISNI